MPPTITKTGEVTSPAFAGSPAEALDLIATAIARGIDEPTICARLAPIVEAVRAMEDWIAARAAREVDVMGAQLEQARAEFAAARLTINEQNFKRDIACVIGVLNEDRSLLDVFKLIREHVGTIRGALGADDGITLSDLAATIPIALRRRA